MDRRTFVRWAGVGWLASSLSALMSACNSLVADLVQTPNSLTMEPASNTQAPNSSTIERAADPDLLKEGFIQVGTVEELSQHGALHQKIGGKPVLIVGDQSDPNTIQAFDPICTHQGCQVDWRSQDRHIFCPCHGSTFSLSGEVIRGPAVQPLKRYAVRIDQDMIFVQLSQVPLGSSG